VAEKEYAELSPVCEAERIELVKAQCGVSGRLTK